MRRRQGALPRSKNMGILADRRDIIKFNSYLDGVRLYSLCERCGHPLISHIHKYGYELNCDQCECRKYRR